MRITDTIPGALHTAKLATGYKAKTALVAGSGPSTDDDVQLSEVAEALKIGQEALQTKFGEQIAAAFDKLGVDLQQTVGIDYSPEAVSDRVTDFAAGIFSMYSQSRPELSHEETVDKFSSLFQGGVDSGYLEAIDLLEGMNMPESVLDVSRETKSLIDQKLEDLFASLREPAEETPAEETQAQ